MILSLKKTFPWGPPTDFQRKIRCQEKIHTIREDKSNRWKPGNMIHFATGVRTSNYNQFYSGCVKSVQSIEIKEMIQAETDKCYVHIYRDGKDLTSKIFVVDIDGKRLTKDQIHSLANSDGFDCTNDFFRFFINGFKGKIIHWTDLKY